MSVNDVGLGILAASPQNVAASAGTLPRQPEAPATVADAIVPGPAANAPGDLLAAHANATAPPPQPLYERPGWNDASRGVNANLGDTESALKLFYDAHPKLQGQPPADGTPEAQKLKTLHLWADAKAAAVERDPAQTAWLPDSRTVTVTAADRKAAWTIYSAQHPELNGKEPAATSKAGRDVAAFTQVVAQNKYDHTLDSAAAASGVPGLTPKVLKSMLFQESNFNPDVGANAYGYTGIAQLSKEAARTAGLTVDAKVDERNDPLKAIPAAASTLKDKARAMAGAYGTFGVPRDKQIEYTVAAYNFGEGSVQKAMAFTAESGRDPAKFADLFEPVNDPSQSGVWRAAEFFGMDGSEKYGEVRAYAPEILQRANQPDP